MKFIHGRGSSEIYPQVLVADEFQPWRIHIIIGRLISELRLLFRGDLNSCMADGLHPAQSCFIWPPDKHIGSSGFCAQAHSSASSGCAFRLPSVVAGSWRQQLSCASTQSCIPTPRRYLLGFSGPPAPMYSLGSWWQQLPCTRCATQVRGEKRHFGLRGLLDV